MAPATTPVKRPSFGGQIKVSGSDWKLSPANTARLEPLISDPLTTSVDSLVLGWGDELEIGDAVVLLVSIGVMKGESFWNGSVCSFPDKDVLQSQFSADASPQVSFSGDVESVRSFWFRSSFSHAQSLTVSQLHVK